jgi:predicted HicB family RNase H-like nuclease
MPKPKKVGRPKMAKGQAKATIMPVRLSPEDRKRIEKAAKAKNQIVSQWVRGTLNAALEA